MCYQEESVPTVQISARIDQRLKQALDEVCRSRGIVMNHFIQEAILDRLEELEDIEDLKAIRHEPTRPFAEVLAELKRDGKV
jgi:predicted DNA-binding protein